MSTRIRTLAIIGLGGRIADVARNLLAAEPRLTLIGYADPDPVGLRALQEAGIDAGHGFADHVSMLRQLKPDHVLIGSPNHLHLTHITAALQAGCHVFSEKPVVITPEETWAAAELLRAYGQERFLVGLVLRSAPLFRQIMSGLNDGRIGRPVSMEANEILSPEHGGFLMRNWRRYRKYSGSHLLEKCCHDLDLHQAVLGSRIVRAASFAGRGVFIPEHEADLATAPDGTPRYQQWGSGWREGATNAVFTSDGDIVDHQVIIAECENGARLTFHINNHGAWSQRRWLICGVRGAVESDLATGALRWQTTYGPSEQTDLDGNGGHYGADQAMARDLAAAWFDGVPFPVPTRAALEAGLAAMLIDRAQCEGVIADGRAWWQRLDGILAGTPAAAAY